jgi:hypothetical protein
MVAAANGSALRTSNTLEQRAWLFLRMAADAYGSAGCPGCPGSIEEACFVAVFVRVVVVA